MRSVDDLKLHYAFRSKLYKQCSLVWFILNSKRCVIIIKSLLSVKLLKTTFNTFRKTPDCTRHYLPNSQFYARFGLTQCLEIAIIKFFVNRSQTVKRNRLPNVQRRRAMEQSRDICPPTVSQVSIASAVARLHRMIRNTRRKDG